MSVVFRGGSSGNRADYLPPVPDRGIPQPVLDTATDGAEDSTINLNANGFREHRHGQHRTPDFMPTGGTIPEGSPDITDPEA